MVDYIGKNTCKNENLFEKIYRFPRKRCDENSSSKYCCPFHKTVSRQEVFPLTRFLTVLRSNPVILAVSS
jgi:hypothetical protein